MSERLVASTHRKIARIYSARLMKGGANTKLIYKHPFDFYYKRRTACIVRIHDDRGLLWAGKDIAINQSRLSRCHLFSTPPGCARTLPRSGQSSDSRTPSIAISKAQEFLLLDAIGGHTLATACRSLIFIEIGLFKQLTARI